jgi:hypothetical protein
MEVENREEEAQRHWQIFLSICKVLVQLKESVTLYDLIVFSAQIVDSPILELIVEGRKLYLAFKRMVQSDQCPALKIAQERFYGKKHILPNDCFSDFTNFYNNVTMAVSSLDFTDEFPALWMNFKSTLCEVALSQINLEEVANYLDVEQRRTKQLAYGNVVECIGQNMSKIEDPIFWDYLSAICLTNKQLCEEQQRASCPLKASCGMQTP